MSLTAIVKSVLSPDTVVLRSAVVPGLGVVPAERVLHLQGIQSIARIGNKDRADEPLAFAARQFLISLLIGKPVTFDLTSTPGAAGTEYGILYFNSLDVAVECVRAGWATVRDSKSEDDNDPRRIALNDAAIQAQAAQVGVYSVAPLDIKVNPVMPLDPPAFLHRFNKQPIDAFVESVQNGSSIRVRLLLSPTEHQMINLRLAGISAPRASNLDGKDGEEFGDQAKFFLESRLLQRSIQVTLLSLPTPSTQGGLSALSLDSAPPVATAFIGTVLHPAGNIAALAVGTGLVKIIDWHAGFLGVGMSDLRKAEAQAKAARRGHFKDLPLPSATAANTNGTKAAPVLAYEGVVTRVWGADMLSILPTGATEDQRIALSSIRQPRPVGPQAGLQLEGKELLRKKLIGKTVQVLVDYVKPAQAQYEAQDCATIKINGVNIGLQLVNKGLCSVVRHRSGEDKSSCYDELMMAEAKAMEDKKGVHSGKDVLAPRPLVDASESSAKATPFLSALQRSGKTPATVDYVASGSRFKLIVPKHNCKLTLVLAGVRCPRTARSTGEKGEPFGQEAATFTSRLLLQRDVEVTIENVDRTGGFIGSLSINGVDVAQMLVREGLARIDEYSTPSKSLVEAEQAAKQARKNIWKSYDAEAEAATSDQVVEAVSTKKEYVDAMVSDVRGDKETPFSFAIQILTANGAIPELEAMMAQLQSSITAAPSQYTPRHNDIVAAQFSADNTWYRARITKSNPAAQQANVRYIDYGNSELLHYSRLRPLSASLSAIPAFAKEAQLSFVALLDPASEYGPEAVERFQDYTEGRKLVACIDLKEPNLLHISLFDPQNSSSADASINIALVRDGLARVDTKSRLRQVAPSVVLAKAAEEAKRSRAGAYELGDIFED